MTHWTTMAMAVAAGTLSVLLALGAIRLLEPGLSTALLPRWRARRAVTELRAEPLSFLFRGHQLVDATAPARALLAGVPGSDDWLRLNAWLSRRFEGIPAALDRARQSGRAECTGARGLGAATLRLVAEDLGDGLLRLQISDPAAENAGIVVDSQSLAAMEEELAILRDAVDHNPVLIWREGLDGRVAWANAAYLREVEARSGDEILWPMPRLIDLAEQDEQAVLRARIDSEDRTQWFDCHVQPAADGRTIHAVPADSAVRAERSLREFVQTLTKTFADLPIGLAIFDRERRLQLFNPALIDLTGLATGFLTARPTLYAVLDTLRESRMVPEPKDYRSWRNMMATLEAAAATGHHVETWSLPGGQTYRVTGRPHPDGAIAFLFEDITAEMAMTRRFRAELSLGAEILDAVDEAVAIFDAGGRLLSVNRAYGALWGMDQPAGLRGHLELWHNGSARAAGHDALRQALAGDLGSRIPQGTITAPDGTSLPWRVRALSGGRRMVLFGEGRPPSAAVGATPHRAEPSMRASAASTPAEWLEPAGVI